ERRLARERDLPAIGREAPSGDGSRHRHATAERCERRRIEPCELRLLRLPDDPEERPDALLRRSGRRGGGRDRDRCEDRRSKCAHDPATPREGRSEEHTSELQSQSNLVCRLLLEKKKKKT